MPNVLHPGQPRDNQRQRLYDAERVLRGRRVSPAAKRCLKDTERHDWLLTEDPNAVLESTEDQWPIYRHEDGTEERLRPKKYVPMRYPSTRAVQAYLDEVTSAAWFIRRWGRYRLTYRNGKGSHGGYGSLTVSREHRRSEAVILHEVAHNLCDLYRYAYHGPEFAAILLTLVRYQMGKQHADDLKASFAKHRVKYRAGVKAVPKPSDERWQRAKAAKR